MAADFWRSSHAEQWLLSKDDLLEARKYDLVTLGEEDYERLMIVYCQIIQYIAEHLKVKQQVAATAQVYFRRFYCRYPLKSIAPLLMTSTCLFLAAKIEEFGPIVQARFPNACTTVVKQKFQHIHADFVYMMKDILQAEFYLLECMDCCLIVYQPYRPLMQYSTNMDLDEKTLNHAWYIVNDVVKSDCTLQYPPFEIAIAAIQISMSTIQTSPTNLEKYKSWMVDMNVDINRILRIIREIFAFYELWQSIEATDGQFYPGIVQRILEKVQQPSNGSGGAAPAPAQPHLNKLLAF